jgi:uncharacterized protein (TIGR03382 family)
VPTLKDCYQKGTKRGQCDASRFPITEYKLELAGAHPRAAHVVTVGDDKLQPAATALAGDGWGGVRIGGVRDAVVVWALKDDLPLAYRAPRRAHVTHVVLSPDKTATATATVAGDDCAVTVAAGSGSARPLILTLDHDCKVAVDPPAASPASASLPQIPGASSRNHAARRGCCGAQASPGSSLTMAIVVLVILSRRRRATSRRSAPTAR